MNERKLHNGLKVDTDTANGLTRAIIDAITTAGGVAWRQNVIAFRGRATHCKGLPDVVAVYGGRFVGVEVKVGKDTQSEWQRAFQAKSERAGGIYIIAKTYDGFMVDFEALKRTIRAEKYALMAKERGGRCEQ